MAKPAAATFKETLRRLAVAPRQAVFIDDTREHVQAARSLGLWAIHFRDSNALNGELGALLGEPIDAKS
jgi:putative hydrolase of the HAD superfamily